MPAPQIRKDLVGRPAFALLHLRHALLHGGLDIEALGVRFVRRFVWKLTPLFVFPDHKQIVGHLYGL